MSRNSRVHEALLGAEKEGRLHHAYLLAGAEAPAKRETVERLAARFARGDEPAELDRIRRGNHPDFLTIAPVEGLINVDAVRVLPKALSYPPLESKRRVVLIEGAGDMNGQAANALLKILEEPPPHTMFFLLAREPSELLPTIVSRCQVLRFAPLTEAEMRAAVGEREADFAALSAWSDGSVARAELLLATEGAFDLRREACEVLLNLWEASPRIPSAALAWVEALASEESTEIALGSWELLLRDLAFAAAGASAKDLRFPEFHGRVAALARAAAVDEVAGKSSSLNRFRVYRQFNGNLRLDFAALLTELQIFSVGKARGRE